MSGVDIASESDRLPEDPKRRGLCRLAFEDGTTWIALSSEACGLLASGRSAWWPSLAPLNKYERAVVRRHVMEMAKHRLATRQAEESVAV